MRLKHITFTGIDAHTDINELKKIQAEFPIAEFGVLTSYHWQENGNRYPSPELIQSLRNHELKLALHLCGSIAHDATEGLWEAVDNHLMYSLDIFQRVQLNISNRQDNPYRLASTPTRNTEVIIQQKNVHSLEFFNRSQFLNTSVLLDASGGLGINTTIEVLPNKFDNGTSAFKVGYAGGINPDNVAEKLTFLLENEQVGDFWIDMESGVRTNDWMDLDKVRRVLEICQTIISKQ